MKRSLLSLAVLLAVVVLAALLVHCGVGPQEPSQSQLSRAKCEAAMKRLHITDATLLTNCAVPTPDHSAEKLSTAPTTWGGRSGTAVTIGFTTGTERFKGAEQVALRLDRGPFYVSDFAVSVMKLEPRALTLFFPNSEVDLIMLKHLPEAIGAETLIIIPCKPNRVCG